MIAALFFALASSFPAPAGAEVNHAVVEPRFIGEFRQGLDDFVGLPLSTASSTSSSPLSIPITRSSRPLALIRGYRPPSCF